MRDDINPLFDYAEALSGPVPEYLNQIERRTHLQTLAPQMMCSALQGRILSLLSKLQRPERILELGTFTGYSALCMAEGLAPGGELITVEGKPEHALMARRNIDGTPFADRISVVEKDVLAYLQGYKSANFDLIFLDAKKRDYRRYFDLAFPHLRSGGLLISDNVTWDGRVLDSEDEEAIATGLPAYNQFLAEHEEVEVVMLPLRDGLSIARKKK
ncbi:MAG: O-methyltransferase [Bacteroidota bacterium]